MLIQKPTHILCCKICRKKQSSIFCLFEESPCSKTSVTQWNYKTLIGCVNTNQKQPRFFLITYSYVLNCFCSFSLLASLILPIIGYWLYMCVLLDLSFFDVVVKIYRHADQSDRWKFVLWYIQETTNKKQYTIYKKPKTHLKSSLNS